MKKITLLLLSLLVVAGLHAINWKDASGVTTTDAVNPNYVEECPIPGSATFSNICYGGGVINVNYTDGALLDIGSTNNGGYFVVAITAQEAGRYNVTISVATNTTTENERGVNVEVFNSTDECSTAAVNADLTKYSVGSGWSDWKTLNWIIEMPANTTQYLRIRAVKASTSWVWNMNGITFTKYSLYADLQTAIAKSSSYLETVSTYGKMSQQALETFMGVIGEVNGIGSGQSDEVYQAAIDKLAAAELVLKAEVDKPFVIPCIIDMPVYTASNGVQFAGDPISGYTYGETHNGSYVIIAVNADQSGQFAAQFSASSNRDDYPCLVSFTASKDLSALKAAAFDKSHAVTVVRGEVPDGSTHSWDVFADYTSPGFDVISGETYYVKVMFGVFDENGNGMDSFVANIKNLEIKLLQSYGAYSELQADIIDAKDLLTLYSDINSVEYGRVSDADREMLQSAITTAEMITSSATEAEVNAARTALAAAITSFKAGASKFNYVPSKLNLTLYAHVNNMDIPTADAGGGSHNNSWIMFKIGVRKSGVYKFSMDASTNNTTVPGFNVICGQDSTTTAQQAINPDETIEVPRVDPGWTGFVNYTVNKDFELLEGQIYYFKMTTVSPENWAINFRNIVLSLEREYSAQEILETVIKQAQDLLDSYRDENDANFNRALEVDKANLEAAINTAKAATDYAAGKIELEQAIDAFNAKVIPYSVIPGLLDLSLLNIKYEGVNNDMKFTKTSIGSTRNNSYVIYKFRTRAGGGYTPHISASTNQDPATDEPKVNMTISEDLETLKAEDFVPDENNTRNIIKGEDGWNSYDIYEYDENTLEQNKDYYVRLSFTSNVAWVANINEVKFTLTNPNSINKVNASTLNVYPNPATDYITVSNEGLVTITGLTGSIQLKKQVNAGEKIYIGNLVSGIYLVNVVSDGKNEVVKLIVK